MHTQEEKKEEEKRYFYAWKWNEMNNERYTKMEKVTFDNCFCDKPRENEGTPRFLLDKPNR